MIARTWHGRVPAEEADAYHQYLLETGVAEYQSVEGNKGVHVLRNVEEGEAHFVLLTFWESIEAIKKFAGDDVERAKYYPEDADYLLEFEETVTHYEVLV